MSSPTVLYVDFNDTDAKRNVTAWRSRENAEARVVPGEEVRLVDDDGFTCRGLVQRASKQAILVAPAWSTWRNPEPFLTSSSSPKRTFAQQTSATAAASHRQPSATATPVLAVITRSAR